MKILALSYLYPNSQYPHYGIFVHNRLKAVSRYHEVKVINPIPWFPGCGRLSRYRNYNAIPAHETIDGLEVFHPRFPIIPRFCKSLDALSYRAAVMPLVAKLRQTYPFDLIDLHWTYPDLPTGTALKKKYGKKMVVTLRGKEAFHRGEGPIREALIRKHLLRADAVISLSRELQDMAVEVGVEAERCNVIRNGVDTSRFYYMDKRQCRKDLSLSMDKYIILSVGGIVYRKGFDRVIKSLTYLPENVCYVIIGEEGLEGNFKRDLLGFINASELHDRVMFAGQVDNHKLNLWYNAADLFVLSSRGEGSPNVLSEALACGCPAVATNVGAVKDLIGENLIGNMTENNGIALRKGILKAMRTRWDRVTIHNLWKKYDWEWCARKTIKILESLEENSK